MIKRIFFDAETGARPEEEISHLMPEISAPANYKDEEKIAAYIAEKKRTWMDSAALSAVTGKVLAIGFRSGGENLIIGTGDEAAVIREFWSQVKKAAAEGAILVGFYISRFDIPFLVRRSWALGVPVPLGVFNGRYLNHNVFLDLFDEWQCGDRQESISLKRLSEFLSVGTKDKDGALAFQDKWVTDRKAAIAYLENDLLLTEAVANKLLGPWPPVSTLPAFITSLSKARKLTPQCEGLSDVISKVPRKKRKQVVEEAIATVQLETAAPEQNGAKAVTYAGDF